MAGYIHRTAMIFHATGLHGRMTWLVAGSAQHLPPYGARYPSATPCLQACTSVRRTPSDGAGDDMLQPLLQGAAAS